MSESNELEALSATLGAKVAESRPLDTSVLNKDNESIKLVSVEQWIENVNELSKLGVGVIVKPSDDVKLHLIFIILMMVEDILRLTC